MIRSASHPLRFRPIAWQRLLSLVLAGLVLLAVGFLLLPISSSGLVSHANPAQSYEEAMQRLQTLQATEGSDLNPVCLTRALTHGERTERVIVLFHGFSNCPNQYRDLSRQLYDAGYTVLMPRLPRHGMADRLSEDPAMLTAEEMVTLADESVDIAQGLGDEVILVGFSTGGVLAAWTAEQRNDIDAAAMIAPAFAFQAIPRAVTPQAARLFAILPNFWRWWDAEKKEALVGPQHAYPRFSSRAFAQVLRLGLVVQERAAQDLPPTARLLVVTNATDESVDNQATYEVIGHWQQQRANVQSYEFPAAMGLSHDFLDPDQPEQQIDVVYPVLLKLLSNLRQESIHAQ
jgi:pimeloyl-ACP methyl ester carboxylesterase